MTSPGLDLPRTADRARRWDRYLTELREFATVDHPFEATGTLVRVTGLVLEAAGIRVPVGSICEVITPGSEVHGLASGARVVPRPAPAVPPRWGEQGHPWRRREDRSLHLPMGDGLLGRVLDAHGVPPCAGRWTPACAPSTPCSPWAAASAWACSPAPAWASRCCWA